MLAQELNHVLHLLCVVEAYSHKTVNNSLNFSCQY